MTEESNDKRYRIKDTEENADGETGKKTKRANIDE